MKRREFCILTTSAGVGALCGWLLPMLEPLPSASRSLPQLRGDLRLSDQELKFGDTVVGKFDALAAAILQQLDGTNNIPEIAEKLHSYGSVSAGNIACFCLLLEDANLLTSPLNIQVFSQEYQT